MEESKPVRRVCDVVVDDEDIATSKVVQGFTAMTHLLQAGSCAP